MQQDPDSRYSFGNAISPMDRHGGDINEPALRQMLRYMADGGTTVCIGGWHATEFIHLNPAEKLRVWEIAVDELGGNAPVSATPVGPASTRDMVAMFRTAKEMGFDSAQLYPAGSGGFGADGLFVSEVEHYYRTVLDAIDMPLFLMNYHLGEIIDGPNKRVPHDLLLRLIADYPQIRGVGIIFDDADSVRSFTSALAGRCHVRISGGLDWFAAMEAGAYGFHSIQQSFAPRLCSRMMDAFHTGDHAMARRLSDRIRALNAIIHRHDRYYPRTIKPALRYLGFDVGDIRPPHMSMGHDAERDLWADLASIDFAETECLPSGGPISLWD